MCCFLVLYFDVCCKYSVNNVVHARKHNLNPTLTLDISKPDGDGDVIEV